MIPITYFRSSSMGTWDFCQQKYMLTYTLGMKDKSNLKAVLGSVCHAVLEALGNTKLAKKNKKRKIKDDLFDNKLSDFEDLEWLTRTCFDYYTGHEPTLTFEEKDYKTCLKWVKKALAFQDGAMDPRKQNIHATETFFDITIPHEWASYEYELNGEEISGQLKLRGTIDVVISEGDTYFQVLDYKTGQRLNWATGEMKEAKDFQKDPQLLLYYYALKTMYPENDYYMSIYYINHGGPKHPDEGGIFSVVFDDNDFAVAEQMIKDKFETIRNTEVPELLSQNNSHWKCKYLCAYSAPSTEDPTMTTCQFMQKQIKENGGIKTMEKFGDVHKLTTYLDGGGVVAAVRDSRENNKRAQ